MRPLFCSALLLCASLATTGSARAELPSKLPAGETFDRLAALLEAIPQRWESLPEPVVPVSGRSFEEIMKSATPWQRVKALLGTGALWMTVSADWPAQIREELQGQTPTELDLWLPGGLVEQLRVFDLVQAAQALEAWIQGAEAAGRKDILVYAAALGIDILASQRGASAVLPLADRWAALPSSPGAESGRTVLEIAIGGLQFHLGEAERARETYRRAHELAESIGDQNLQGAVWRGEAQVLSLLGQLQPALQAYRTAREHFVAAKDPLGEVNTWFGEAEVLSHLDDSEKALQAYRKGRDLSALIYNRLGQGNSWLGEAEILFWRGANDEALEGFRKARTFFEAAGEASGQARAWLGEALCHMRNQEWEKAVEAATAAIRLGTLDVVPSQLLAFLVKAKAEEEFGDLSAAARSSIKAIDLHARWRNAWITDYHRTVWEERINVAYDILVPLRAREKGRAAEALRLAEEARSRVLLDLLAVPPGRGESVAAIDLMAKRQRLEAELWQIEEELGRFPKRVRQEELHARRHQLGQELEWNHYQRIAAQEGSFPEAPPLDAPAIQTLARETGPLLLFYAAEDEAWGFLIDAETDEIFMRPIALSWDELGRAVRGLAYGLANPLYEPRTEALARQLWDLLIAPFSDRVPAGGPLVLVPHGPLHELPFEALLDPTGKPLSERWQISVTPSASALQYARSRRAASSPQDSFLAFSSGQGLTLPVEEMAEISGFFGVNKATFLPTEARFQNYEKLVTRARHLLIATRGVHIQGSRSETYLEIQPTPEAHDSRLTAAAIATIPLQAELVTLAACDTSHGRALLSDERLDLTRAFLIARAAAVLATRWKVPEDAATSRFLADFYRAYRQGGPEGKGMRKDEALTEARRRSRERGDPAQVWAAWVLVGDAR